MVSSSEIRLLRKMAHRLREIAQAHPTDISAKLIEVAQEFEQQAEEIAKRQRH